jgi:[acyl-carrier-protein] S-malonyltransferase
MLTLLCAGQGTLSSDMFRLTEEHPTAQPIFQEARSALGHDPRHLVRGDADTYRANRVGQVLVVTAALALHACLKDILPKEFAVAGYSVGEMAAWSVAGVWSSRTAIELTDRRAEAMDAAGGHDGRLAYVRGLGREIVANLAQAHGCALAIVNPGDLLIIGGNRADIDALCASALAEGAAKSSPIDVHIASHTPLLQDAVLPVRDALQSVEAKPLRTGAILLSGNGGDRVFNADRAIPRLAADVARTIEWKGALEAVMELGTTQILDLGPGHALAEMSRGVDANVMARAADDFRSVEGVRAWLQADRD